MKVGRGFVQPSLAVQARNLAVGAVEAEDIFQPVNLGSGVGVSVKRVVEIIVDRLKKKPKVVWDAAKPAGDRIRLMDISRARSLGWEPKVAIEEGIRDAMDWYESNRADADKRYNVFTQKQS